MISDWLQAHPHIRNAIKWKTEDWLMTYNNWNSDQKADLEEAYESIVNYQWVWVNDPPENIKEVRDDQWPPTVLSVQDAWDIFVAHVAQCLAVETESWVNWSLLNYSSRDLATLLDSRQFYKYIESFGGYIIEVDVGGECVPGIPSLPYALLKHNNLLANTRLKTIGNLLHWCKGLFHYGPPHPKYSDRGADLNEGFWQYRGFPPVSRMILGTKCTLDGMPEHQRKGHFTAGCHGTMGFLRAVLRTVNIPVEARKYGSHRQVYFPTEELYMAHGDDPYDRSLKELLCPWEEILMNEQKYSELFIHPGHHYPVDERKRRMQVHLQDLLIKYIPPQMLRDRCSDRQNNTEKPKSLVYKEFKESYTVGELEQKELWSSLDKKIDAYGGCNKIPRSGEPDRLWKSWHRAKFIRSMSKLRRSRRGRKVKRKGIPQPLSLTAMFQEKLKNKPNALSEKHFTPTE